MTAMHQELDRLRLAAAATGAGIWDYDIDADRLYCDERWYAILGLDPSRPILSVDEFKPYIHPEDRDRATQVSGTFEELTARGSDYHILYRVIRADGVVRWVRSAACLIKAGPNSPNRAVGALVDVTEQVATQSALAESGQLFRTLADTVPQIIFGARADGTIDYLNKRWGEFTGGTGKVDNAVWQSYLHPDDEECITAAWQTAVETGGAFEAEFRYLHHSGEYRWMAAEAAPLLDDERNVVRWFGSITDINDAKRLAAERELVARELDHRLKNIFALVGGLINLSVRDEPEMKPYAEGLQLRLSALAKAHDLIRPDDGKGVTLQTLIRTLLAPYENAAAPRISITGIDMEIESRSITPVALLVHELATNANKYGALQSADGSLGIAIARAGEDVRLEWVERARRPDHAPSLPSSGFGSKLLTLVVERQLGGQFTREVLAEGMHVSLTLPRTRLEASVAIPSD